jgi:YVTN family beta-propeller protein
LRWRRRLLHAFSCALACACGGTVVADAASADAPSGIVVRVGRDGDVSPGRVGEDPMHRAIAAGVRHGQELVRQRIERTLALRDADNFLADYDPPLVAATTPAPPVRASAGNAQTWRGERVYVTNERSGELSVLDPATRTVRATLALGRRPRGLALSPDGSYLYVALSGSLIGGPGVDESKLPPPDKKADGIGVVALGTLRLVRTLRGVSDPEQLVVSRDGRKIYVASADTGSAIVLDTKSGKVLAALTVGREPEGIGISPDGRWVYVSSEAENEVAVIDTQIDAVVANVPTCERPRAVVFARTKPRAYVSCEDSAEVAVFDALRHRETGRAKIPGLGARPMGLALSPDEKTLYVATGRGGTLVALSTKRHRTLASVAVGQRPWGISISMDGSRVYTANGPSNDVSIVDARNMRVIERVQVGTGPWATLAHDGAGPVAGNDPHLDADDTIR